MTKTVKTQSTFRMEYSVTININAKPDKIWTLLTDAPGYVSWNSTIKSLEGNIAKGSKIKLRAKLDEKRVFTLTVAEIKPMEKMVWKSGAAPMFKGVRTYTLTPGPDGTTDFTICCQ